MAIDYLEALTCYYVECEKQAPDEEPAYPSDALSYRDKDQWCLSNIDGDLATVDIRSGRVRLLKSD